MIGDGISQLSRLYVYQRADDTDEEGICELIEIAVSETEDSRGQNYRVSLSERKELVADDLAEEDLLKDRREDHDEYDINDDIALGNERLDRIARGVAEYRLHNGDNYI